MITYHPKPNGNIGVKLDKKAIGEIRKKKDGYRYFPKGSKTSGDPFPSLQQCKNSLEEE